MRTGRQISDITAAAGPASGCIADRRRHSPRSRCATNSARGISRAPSVNRWSLATWQSISSTLRSPQRLHQCVQRHLARVGRRAEHRLAEEDAADQQHRTGRRPAARRRRPARPRPNARAPGGAVRRRRPASAGEIQVPSRPRVPLSAHCAIDLVEARVEASRLKTSRRSVWRRLRETFSSSGNSTMRGSGDHHRIGCPAEYQGKMPRR